jgi:hypothetical protein
MSEENKEKVLEGRCGTCRKMETVGPGKLECHSGPPQTNVVLIPVDVPRGIVGGNAGGPGFQIRTISGFPPVQSADWCSKWADARIEAIE